MLSWLFPDERKFFEHFSGIATRLTAVAELLEQALDDPARLPAILAQIDRVQHETDEAAHDLDLNVDKLFIPPMDREDIHLLASRLDDVMDLIDGTASRVQMYQAGEAPPGAILMADVVLRSTQQLLVAVMGLEKNKDRVVLDACAQVKRLEEEGDSVYHEWVARLFDGSPDALIVIKWKEIYDTLEKTLDHMEDAGNVLESISIKHG